MSGVQRAGSAYPMHALLAISRHRIRRVFRSPPSPRGLPLTVLNRLPLLARHALGTAAVGVSLNLLAFLTGPLTARALGSAGRGDIARVLAPISLLTLAMSLGFPNAAGYLEDKEDRGRLLGNSLIAVSVLGCPILAVCLILLPTYLGSRGGLTAICLFYLASVIPFIYGTVVFEIIRGEGNLRSFNYLRSIPFVGNAVGVVGAYVAGHLTVKVALTSQLLANAVFCVSATRHARNWGLTLKLDLSLMKRQLSYGSRALVTHASDSVTFMLDQVVLATQVSSSELGQYVVAVTYTLALVPLAAGLNASAFAEFKRRNGAEGELLRRRTLVSSVLLASLGAIMLGALAPIVLPALFGPQFGESVSLVWILLPGQAFADTYATIVGRKLALGETAVPLRSSLVAAVVTVVGLVVFVPHGGAVAAAEVTTVAYTVRLVCAAVWSRGRRFGAQ